jgi:hypothetical protein
MSTNKIKLVTTEQFMADYRPSYAPLYSLFLGRSQKYSAEVGKVNFNRLDAMGDIRQKHITPKDTELRQFAAREGTKGFKKYFLANQFVHSLLQGSDGIEGIKAQALEEHQKQADDLLLLGEGTAANNVINNGLYWSGDSNYILNSSEELANAPDTQSEMYDLVQTTVAQAESVPGRKAIMFYGSSSIGKLSSFFPNTTESVRKVLQDSLGGEYSIVKIPSVVTPSNANGWIIVNFDSVNLHYTLMPEVRDQGINDEKMYAWFNFLMGSMMLEVEASGAVVRQPVTFEA